MNNKILIGIVAVVLVGAMYIFFGMSGSVVKAELVEAGDSMKLLVDGVSETAEFFEYSGIEFFVVRAAGGSVKTAFNACDVCYRSRKGYRQEGDDMVCNNCGNHYRISGLGTQNLKGGGCWPGYLESTAEGDYLVIAKASLESGRYRFS